MDLESLKALSINQLIEFAEKQLDVGSCARMQKQEVIFTILKHLADHGEEIKGSGVLELHPDGFGFLRSADCSYLAGPDDIYVSPNQIRRFNLRTGDTIMGIIRPPKDNERYFALLRVDEINGEDAEQVKNKTLFENLTPLHAMDQLVLERKGISTKDNITPRLIDFISPIGKGQRGLIVAPPKAGKTELLKSIAVSITNNNPECELIVLLIDERPEEVTEMSRTVKGEVVASTFDEPAARHVQVAEMVIERAKRLVEHKKDVVILLDSITRLARAYNTVTPSSGKVLSGGIDANALHRPKRFFGAARNVEEGGSLTIIATALVDTGSKMDDVIYEEFKGTGNMELHLSRRVAERRLFPAIDVLPSSTRKEDLMLTPDVIEVQWEVRKILSEESNEIERLKLLMETIEKTQDNHEMLEFFRKKYVIEAK
ncbi:transcription termination factor Rho [Psittacicella hinzii]|uniref:Transcription termination factor Rho n=1 Tax=Psittacicella hinzii TaxID=2028575 RepID=A0A3A1YKR8_9GAMM|nr:transcription termination factor Rho [Psittacicella hinzii]RIY38863.1 transcription termination factor Rho [Psittacicella hinzii]